MGNNGPTSWLSLPQRLRLQSNEMDSALWQFACTLRVAVPAIITAINTTHNPLTISAQPAIQENMNIETPDGQGLSVPVSAPVTIQPINDVVVCFFGGNGFTVRPSIAVGDECLLIFCDNCLDAWWQSGGVQAQLDPRRHDISDAIAIVGLRSQVKPLAAYNPAVLQIASDDGTIAVEVGTGGVKITHPTLIEMNGPVLINGTLGVSGNTQIQGRNFSSHVHTGVTTGGGDTGPPL